MTKGYKDLLEDVDNQLMEWKMFQEEVKALKCKKHPTYQAKLKPKVKCKQCEKMYKFICECYIHGA